VFEDTFALLNGDAVLFDRPGGVARIKIPAQRILQANLVQLLEVDGDYAKVSPVAWGQGWFSSYCYDGFFYPGARVVLWVRTDSFAPVLSRTIDLQFSDGTRVQALAGTAVKVYENHPIGIHVGSEWIELELPSSLVRDRFIPDIASANAFGKVEEFEVTFRLQSKGHDADEKLKVRSGGSDVQIDDGVPLTLNDRQLDPSWLRYGVIRNGVLHWASLPGEETRVALASRCVRWTLRAGTQKQFTLRDPPRFNRWTSDPDAPPIAANTRLVWEDGQLAGRAEHTISAGSSYFDMVKDQCLVVYDKSLPQLCVHPSDRSAAEENPSEWSRLLDSDEHPSVEPTGLSSFCDSCNGGGGDGSGSIPLDLGEGFIGRPPRGPYVSFIRTANVHTDDQVYRIKAREVINFHLDDFELCAVMVLEKVRRLRFQISIRPDGHVESVAVMGHTSLPSSFASCLVPQTTVWRFPASVDGFRVNVDLKFGQRRLHVH
jgi:hypothetical protein